MVFVVFAGLLLILALMIGTSMFVFASSNHRRSQQTAGGQSLAATQQQPRRPIAILPTAKKGTTVPPPQALSLSPRAPSRQIQRFRMLVSLGLLLMVLLALAMQSGVVGNAEQDIAKQFGITFLSSSSPATDMQLVAHALPAHPTAPVATQTASSRVKRISAVARDQYYSDYQWKTWALSACSGIAMTVVMNAYGRHMIVADVVQREIDLGVWNVDLGLLREEGFAMTASTFGFTTTTSHTRSLQQIIDLANAGTPVIVGLRDYAHFPTGHFIVVYGGTLQSILTADPSYFNYQHMTQGEFLGMWQGFSAVITAQ